MTSISSVGEILSPSKTHKEIEKAFEEQFKDIDNQQLIFLPIRHHSPVTAVKISQILTKYNPHAILVEGPSDANHLIPHFETGDLKPPVSIFTFYSDFKNKFGLNGVLTPKKEVPFRFQSWYPFVEYSPEFVSITEGLKRKLHVEFIDLGLEDRLKLFAKEFSDKKKIKALRHSPLDEHLITDSDYISALVKSSNCRDFNEFWFRFIEIPGLEKSLKKFFVDLFALVLITRFLLDDDEKEETDLREKFMVNQIITYQKDHPDEKILVISGGLHTVHFIEEFFVKNRNKTAKFSSIPKSSLGTNVTITPYSYYRLSQQSGYFAGISYPFYCKMLWDMRASNNPFGISSINSIVGYKVENQLSTADRVSCSFMLQNLTALRGLKYPGPYEVIDAVTSTYIKDEYNKTKFIRELDKFLIGNSVGSIPDDLGTFPLVNDFYNGLKRFRLPDIEEIKTTRLDIYRKDTHRQKSRFLHAVQYLEIGYISSYKGPNFFESSRTDLLTETWDVNWSPSINSKLTELASYGATIDEVVANKIQEDFFETSEIVRKSFLLFKSAQIGLYDIFETFLSEINININILLNFNELIEIFKVYVLLYTAREVLLPKKFPPLTKHILNIYQSLIMRIPNLGNISEEQARPIAQSFRSLSQIITNKELQLIIDPSILFNVIKRVIYQIEHPRLLGILLGFLFLFKKIPAILIENMFSSYAFGTYKNKNSHFDMLEGILILVKAVVFSNKQILAILDQYLESLNEEEFIEALPQVRRIFSVYSPSEINIIGNEIFKLMSLESGQTEDQLKVSLEAELVNKLHDIDKTVKKILKESQLDLTGEGY